MERLLCKKCGKFLRSEAYGTVVARFICPDSKCKYINDIRRIVLDEEHNLKVKFAKTDQEPIKNVKTVEPKEKQLDETPMAEKELAFTKAKLSEATEYIAMLEKTIEDLADE